MTNTVMALQEFQDETVELPALLYNFCTGTSVVTYNLKTKKKEKVYRGHLEGAAVCTGQMWNMERNKTKRQLFKYNTVEKRQLFWKGEIMLLNFVL